MAVSAACKFHHLLLYAYAEGELCYSGPTRRAAASVHSLYWLHCCHISCHTDKNRYTEITSSVSRPNESAGEETEPEIAQESGMDVGDPKVKPSFLHLEGRDGFEGFEMDESHDFA